MCHGLNGLVRPSVHGQHPSLLILSPSILIRLLPPFLKSDRSICTGTSRTRRHIWMGEAAGDRPNLWIVSPPSAPCLCSDPCGLGSALSGPTIQGRWSPTGAGTHFWKRLTCRVIRYAGPDRILRGHRPLHFWKSIHCRYRFHRRNAGLGRRLIGLWGPNWILRAARSGSISGLSGSDRFRKKSSEELFFLFSEIWFFF